MIFCETLPAARPPVAMAAAERLKRKIESPFRKQAACLERRPPPKNGLVFNRQEPSAADLSPIRRDTPHNAPVRAFESDAICDCFLTAAERDQ